MDNRDALMWKLNTENLHAFISSEVYIDGKYGHFLNTGEVLKNIIRTDTRKTKQILQRRSHLQE